MGRTGPWLARLRPAMDLDGGEEGSECRGRRERERGETHTSGGAGDSEYFSR